MKVRATVLTVEEGLGLLEYDAELIGSYRLKLGTRGGAVG
jgi:hypothetical protein